MKIWHIALAEELPIWSSQKTANSAPNEHGTDQQAGFRIQSNQVVPMTDVYQVHGRTCSRVVEFSATNISNLTSRDRTALTITADSTTCH